MLRTLTLSAAALLAIVAPSPANAAIDDSSSEIPFVLEHGYVIVKAKVRRNTPVEVILATGAERSILDSGSGEDQLPVYYNMEGRIVGGERMYVYTVVPDIVLGDIKIASLNMRAGSIGGVSKRVGRRIFGIFGADFFKGRVVQFDFEKKVVRFLRQAPVDVASKNADAATTIVLSMRSYSEDFVVPVTDQVSFNGKTIKTLIDTGAATVVSLSPIATKFLGLSPPPEKGPPGISTLGTLRLDKYELSDVPVTLVAKGSGFDRESYEFGAVLGAGFLQNFVVTFDFRKQLVILKHI